MRSKVLSLLVIISMLVVCVPVVAAAPPAQVKGQDRDPTPACFAVHKKRHAAPIRQDSSHGDCGPIRKRYGRAVENVNTIEGRVA